MAKHRHASTAVLDRPPDDHGHAFVRRNARLVPQARLGAAQGMELADIPDIDRPDQRGASVRVARRIDPLIAILDPLRKDSPGHHQFFAAEEFRRHNAIANGIRPMTWASYITHSYDGQTPAQLLLDAQMKVRQAWLAVRGPKEGTWIVLANGRKTLVPTDVIADVIRLVVLGYQTLQAVDNARRCRHGTSRDVLDVGLERLVDYYGM